MGVTGKDNPGLLMRCLLALQGHTHAQLVLERRILGAWYNNFIILEREFTSGLIFILTLF